MARVNTPSGFGSSPRVRGKHNEFATLVGSHRIIPASAGQTHEYVLGQRAAPDHPRECGANPGSVTKPFKVSGSSPRVRGKPRIDRHVAGVPRIIPASAGQTRCASSYSGYHADHPRECGANRFRPRIKWTPTGSSPRVRGKQSPARRPCRTTRIIPASAGQTFDNALSDPRHSDHPRECGANFATLVGSQLQNGSSPRVRGKLLCNATAAR